jgi:hypothetical protein
MTTVPSATRSTHGRIGTPKKRERLTLENDTTRLASALAPFAVGLVTPYVYPVDREATIALRVDPDRFKRSGERVALTSRITYPDAYRARHWRARFVVLAIPESIEKGTDDKYERRKVGRVNLDEHDMGWRALRRFSGLVLGFFGPGGYLEQLTKTRAVVLVQLEFDYKRPK